MGGFAHLKTLIDRLRGDAGRPLGAARRRRPVAGQRPGQRDAGPRTWSKPANLLGIEAMTGHWEFTYGEKTLRRNLAQFKGEFLAQNVFLTEEAAFNDAPAFDPASGRVFKPATIKEVGGTSDRRSSARRCPMCRSRIPSASCPTGRSASATPSCRRSSTTCAAADKVDAVLLLSHNGMDVDLKLASRVTGIDVILGGHTHDAVPRPVVVANARRQDAGHQCRIERQVSGRPRPRCRQGRASRTCAISCCRSSPTC